MDLGVERNHDFRHVSIPYILSQKSENKGSMILPGTGNLWDQTRPQEDLASNLPSCSALTLQSGPQNPSQKKKNA